jgi:hypothetical protein
MGLPALTNIGRSRESEDGPWTCGPRRFKEARRGGDEAAGNRQAPLPRTLATRAGLLEPYSSQTEEVDTSFLKVVARCHGSEV